MADWILDSDFIELRAVAELDGKRVGDRALVRIEIIARVSAVLDANDLRAQRIDAGIDRDSVLVIGGSQSTENQRHSHHVLDAVIAVGRIGERTRLVDDADRRLVRADGDPADVLEPVFHTRVQSHGAFDRGLGVKFRGIRDLEQHVLHHVAAVRTLEHERPAFEEHVVEAPGLRGERGRIAHLALRGHEREPHAARGRIARGPALARARVRCVTIRAQRRSIDPGKR